MLHLAIASTKTALKKWFTFSGRASRAEYWWAALGITILNSLFIVLLDAMLRGASMAGGPDGLLAEVVIGLVLIVLIIPLCILWLGLGCRRLHDMNRSGWWQLLIFTLIGVIVLTVWYCFKGEEGHNLFGSDSELKETNSADWLVPFIIFLAFIILDPLGGGKNLKRTDSMKSNSSQSSTSAPSVSGVAPVNPAPPNAAPAPAAPALDACEQRMSDFAIQNKADPKTYIAQNQAYLLQCRQSLGGSPQ